jgi:hypothetical protein
MNPHPAVNMVLVQELPGFNKEEEIKSDVIGNVGGVTIHAIDIAELMKPRTPDLCVGIVVEVGPIMGTDEVCDMMAPFAPGCLVYYPDGPSIEIAEYRLVPVKYIVAWTEPFKESPDG